MQACEVGIIQQGNIYFCVDAMISLDHSVLLVHMQMRQGFMKSEMGVNRMTESVFSERVRALHGPLWRIAWAILRNGADCDDAIQETLLRAWNHIGSLRDETAFDAWLMRILVNECKDLLRRRARRPQTSMEAAPELTAPVENIALRDAIFALPLSLRLPLLLHYMEGYSVKETARMLHLPETTVHWRLHAARKRIRDEWN